MNNLPIILNSPMPSFKFLYQLFMSFYPLVFIGLAGILHIVTLPQLGVGYISYCIYVQVSAKTIFIYSQNKKNNEIISLCPTLSKPTFKPHFLLPLCIEQMLALAYLKFSDTSTLKYTRETVNKYGTNGFWATLDDKKPTLNQPILFFMPGMTGNIEDTYVNNLVIEGIKNGYNVVIYQMRIISDTFLLPDDGIFNLIEDVDVSLNGIQSKYKGQIFAVGASYGANNGINYLGQYNVTHKKIQAAVSISNPFDLFICERLAEDTVYESLITFLEKDNFKKIIPGILKSKNKSIDTQLVMSIENMKDYDEYFTRIVFGFNSADEYYKKFSCANHVSKVDIPLLTFNSKDDGLTSEKGIPYDDLRLNENILTVVTDHGAHMCFIGNESFFNLKQWVGKPLFEFLNANRITCDNGKYEL